MPGGIEGIKSMVKDFHSFGVRVLFPYNPCNTNSIIINFFN